MRRAAALALLVLAASLAGCIGDDAPDAAPMAEPEADNATAPGDAPSDAQPGNATHKEDENATGPTAPAFEAPSRLPSEGWWTAEPTVEAASDGSLFMVAPGLTGETPNAVEGAAWLWRSTDGGDTWEVLRQPSFEPQPPSEASFHSGDADVATSPDGWVYYADLWEAGTFVEGQRAAERNVLVEASDDGGETWRKAPVTVPHALADAESIDRPWLVAGEDGFVGLFYAYDPPVTHTSQQVDPLNVHPRIEAVFSIDHGRTWGPPVPVVDDGDPGTFAFISKPVTLGNGTLAMAYGHATGDAGDEVRLAVSTDRGETWSQRAIAEVPEGFGNLWPVQTAADDAGTVHVAWAARTGETMTVYHAATPDGGETVEGPTPVRSAGLNFVPWIDARSHGQVAVGWYGSNATGNPLEAPDRTAWHAYLAERQGSSDPFATTRVSDEPVKVGPMCPGGACSEAFELLDFVGLTYDPDGRLHTAFARSHTADANQTVPAAAHHAAELPEER